MTNTWSTAPLARVDEPRARARRVSGAPLLGTAARGNGVVIEGTGRFVGAPPAGDADCSPDERQRNPGAKSACRARVGDPETGVTLNLVNVPAPQAAKTILGDILGVKYTVAPGIEGKVTI